MHAVMDPNFFFLKKELSCRPGGATATASFSGEGTKKTPKYHQKRNLYGVGEVVQLSQLAFLWKRGWGRGILTEDNEDYTLIMQKYLQILPHPPPPLKILLIKSMIFTLLFTLHQSTLCHCVHLHTPHP